MRNKILLVCCLACFIQPLKAQFAITKGFSDLEISGSLQSIYNYRFYPAGTTDFHKNRFELDYAQLNFRGYVNKYWRYEVNTNVAGLIANTNVEDNSFLTEANVTYRGFDQYLDIEFGYSKLPFSRSSMQSKEDIAFLQRPEVARGDVFSRRDVGITLKSSLWDQKVKLYAGMYNGMGEQSLLGDNDASGNNEFIVRSEISYPSPFDETSIDKANSPVPIVQLGLNARYAKKSSFTGATYGIKTIDGKKLSYGGDLAAKYKGFVASVEMLYFRMEPNDTTVLILESKPTNYVMSAAVIAELSYFCKPLHSALAIRYDEYNPSDLIKGDTEKNLCFAYNYFTKGNSAIRIQYWYRLKLESTDKAWTDDQIRAAWLISF